MSRRRNVEPPVEVPKPEITVRTPETKAFDLNWDQPRNESQMSNGHLGSVESLDISLGCSIRTCKN